MIRWELWELNDSDLPLLWSAIFSYWSLIAEFFGCCVQISIYAGRMSWRFVDWSQMRSWIPNRLMIVILKAINLSMKELLVLQWKRRFKYNNYTAHWFHLHPLNVVLHGSLALTPLPTASLDESGVHLFPPIHVYTANNTRWKLELLHPGGNWRQHLQCARWVDGLDWLAWCCGILWSSFETTLVLPTCSFLFGLPLSVLSYWPLMSPPADTWHEKGILGVNVPFPDWSQSLM